MQVIVYIYDRKVVLLVIDNFLKLMDIISKGYGFVHQDVAQTDNKYNKCLYNGLLINNDLNKCLLTGVLIKNELHIRIDSFNNK